MYHRRPDGDYAAMTITPAPAQTLERAIHRLEKGQIRATQDLVVQEALLALTINGFPAYQLLYLPGQETALCLGFLLSSGVIETTADIQEMRLLPVDAAAGRHFFQVQVRLTKTFANKRDLTALLAAAVLRSDPTAAQPLTAAQFRTSPAQEVQISLATLMNLMADLPKRQEIFQQTGGTHAIYLAETSSGEVILGAEDVGRHNAFDKVIGQALQKNLPTATCIALLSGRASFEMVLKAARAGIPLIASVSAPTSLAIRLADLQGITLVGFARPGRCNIYTHPGRLLAAEPIERPA